MEFPLNPARSIGYVLIVDDVPAMAELIARWLQKAGYKTKIADNYEAAKQILASAPPLVMVIDDCPEDDVYLYQHLPLYTSGGGLFYPDTTIFVLIENRKKWYSPFHGGHGPVAIERIFVKPVDPLELVYWCDACISDRLWPPPYERLTLTADEPYKAPKTYQQPEPIRKPPQKHWKRRNRKFKKKN